ncbi:MAG: GAF domain-containing protein [Holophaga sp.]|nr:GAF domain-containing protein [Holophaga sp.]
MAENHVKPNYRRARVRKAGGPRSHLHALGELVDHSFPDPTRLFDHGLALMVQELGVDHAVMSRLTDLGWEAFWWATAPGIEPDLAIHEPTYSFCPHVLEHPGRTLMIRDAATCPTWKDHRAVREQGIKAYLGAGLCQSGRIIGVLSVTSHKSKAFSHAEVAMVKALANLFGKTLEVEQLKHELRMTRDALDLTTAIVEDSALEAPASRLPNLHYLDIWLKANLFLARRRGESITLVQWTLPLTQDSQKNLREVSEALRGEDLLVDMGHESFLLLLPHTTQEGAQILLERIQSKLGPVPMGATLWNPLHRTDRDDLTLKFGLKRAHLALLRCREICTPRELPIVWNLLIMNPEDEADITKSW